MKRINYSKILLPLFNIIGGVGYAQLTIGDATTPIASPSMAAMSRYSDIPVSIQTGQPGIQIPLMGLSGSSGGFSFPLGISFNSLLKTNDRISDVGRGWSFSAGGVIYKKVVDKFVDEFYDNTSSETYRKNEFDDVYYYNLPGYSGKFMIKRDVNANTFSLVKMTADNLKITYERDNTNTATLKIKSFTVTDDQGMTYSFNTVNINRFKFEDELFGKEYNSAYMLSEIKSPSGASLMSLVYEKKDKYVANLLEFENYRLKSLKSAKGEISLNYTYDEALEKSVNDPYCLKDITLKNPAGQAIYSYVFDYSMTGPASEPLKQRRVLNYTEKRDRNNAKIERTTFVYGATGRMDKIISPQGAVTQYEYEQGDRFFDYNDPVFLANLENNGSFNPVVQYTELLFTNSLDTQQNLNTSFTIPGDPAKKKRYVLGLNIKKEFKNPNGSDIEVPTLPGIPPERPPQNLKFILKKGAEVIREITNYSGNSVEIFNYPGVYTLEAVLDPGVRGVGTYSVSETKFRPQPYRNAVSGGDDRLKAVKFYAGINETAPKKTITYGYDSFELPDSASGYIFDDQDTSSSSSSYTLYKSVKVSETGLGSTRYSFGNPDDYPKQQTGGTTAEPEYFWPYYNITRQGLLTKKEVYDEQNTLLTSEVYTYEPDHYFNQEYKFQGKKITSKTAYMKKTGSVSKAYYPGGTSLEASSETLISPSNLKPYYIKNTADGNISERFLTYAAGQPEYAHLVTSGITGVPVITEEKKNGKLLSRSVTRYEQSSVLPSSVLSANVADGSTRQAAKIDAYDERENPLQVSSEAGPPVSFIFGYNKTQVIAKVEGARYNDIKNHPLVIAAVAASDNDNLNPGTENVLREALDNLRKDSAMASYQLTTYTYDPLVGLTTMTQPNGQRELYEYDDAGRLKTTKRAEKDAAGNTVYKTLKEYQYNYKP
jgi:YD repeat-containing protein